MAACGRCLIPSTEKRDEPERHRELAMPEMPGPFFDINTRRFLSVSCNGCGYTEFYRETASTGSKIIDLLGSG